MKNVIGYDTRGEEVDFDLIAYSNLLVTGVSGSGKTTLLCRLVDFLLADRRRDSPHLTLIDPKNAGLSAYGERADLGVPVIHGQKSAIEALRWAEAESRARWSSPDLKINHRIVDGPEEYSGLEDLPKVITVIDDFDVIYSADPETVTKLVCNIANLSRATGVSIVISTSHSLLLIMQAPEIVECLISRLTFRLYTESESLALLNQSGAEELEKEGQALMYRDVTILPIMSKTPPLALQCLDILKGDYPQAQNSSENFESPNTKSMTSRTSRSAPGKQDLEATFIHTVSPQMREAAKRSKAKRENDARSRKDDPNSHSSAATSEAMTDD